MPLALLLQPNHLMLARWRSLATVWEGIVRMEESVIARARGAFLVRWFGPRLPLEAGRLSIAIVNIQALGEQYRQARADRMGGRFGAGLAEPVAGLSGVLIGVAAPTGVAFVIYDRLAGALPSLFSILLGLLGGIVAAALTPFVLVGAGVFFALRPSPGDGGGMSLVQKYELLGQAAQALHAVNRFIARLTGPREAIGNRLLRGVLELFDAIAAFSAQMLGAVALLVTRIAPMALRNIREGVALMHLGQSVFDLLQALQADTRQRFEEVFGRDSPGDGSLGTAMRRISDAGSDIVDRMLDGFFDAIDGLATLLGTMLSSGMNDVMEAVRAHLRQARELIEDIPLVRSLRGIQLAYGMVSVLIPASTSSSSSGGGMLSGLLSRLLSPPPTPSAPTLPDVRRIMGLLGPPPPPPTLESARAALENPQGGVPRLGGLHFPGLPRLLLDEGTRELAERLAAPPPNQFRGERELIAAELGNVDPETGFAMLREQDLAYRDLLIGVVERVLPPRIAEYLPQLEATFDALDRHIYGQAGGRSEPEHPTLALAPGRALRPVVGRVIVRAPGEDPVGIRGFAERLVERMREQNYVAAGG